MLINHPSQNTSLTHMQSLFDVEMEILGAERHPMRLASGALGSALLVLATSPLTSLLVFATIALFLVFSLYLVMATDAELTRRGATAFRETDRAASRG